MRRELPWTSSDLSRLAEESTLLARARAGREALTGELTMERLREYAAELDRNEELRKSPYGPGGRIRIVDPEMLRRWRPASRDPLPVLAHVEQQVIARTDQLARASEWLAGLGGDPQVVEHDPRIGLTLLETGPVTGDLFEHIVKEADRPVDLGEQRLCLGLNEVIVQAMKVKGLDSPQPTQISLGQRPEGTMAGRGVTVAVIDGGFELADRRRTDGWDAHVIPPSGGAEQVPSGVDVARLSGLGHGTFVSGVVSQVAPDVTIRQYRAADLFGFASSWRVKNLIHEAVADGCQIINISMSTDDPELIGSPALSACLHRLPPSAVVIAAAGNDGWRLPPMPAAHTAALAIGSLDPNLDPESWSNYGTWVDASCVGTVVSTYVSLDGHEENPVRLWSGTSFSAPQVSGLLALELSNGMGIADAWQSLRLTAHGQTGNPLPDYGHRVRIL
ncbi:MAG: S8 family peptidase [Actinomycetales bacterium]